MQWSITPIGVDQHPFPFRTLFVPAYHDWYLPCHDWYTYHGMARSCNAMTDTLTIVHFSQDTWLVILGCNYWSCWDCSWTQSSGYCHATTHWSICSLLCRCSGELYQHSHDEITVTSIHSLSLSFHQPTLSLSLDCLLFTSLMIKTFNQIIKQSIGSQAKSELIETVVPFDTLS